MKHLSLRINALLLAFCLLLSGMAIDTYAQSTVSRQKKTEKKEHKQKSKNTKSSSKRTQSEQSTTTRTTSTAGTSNSVATKTCSLTITSNPTGADLYIDNKRIATTPYTISVEKGKRLKIKCTKTGFSSSECNMLISGSDVLTMVLTPIKQTKSISQAYLQVQTFGLIFASSDFSRDGGRFKTSITRKKGSGTYIMNPVFIVS